jgi:uncharacterized repeat protein (TIGR03803 family)
VLHNFNLQSEPRRLKVEANKREGEFMKRKIIQIMVLAGMMAVLRAQTLTTLHYFELLQRSPIGGLTSSRNTLYGTTGSGEQYPNYGTVFSINTDGSHYVALTNFGGSLTGPSFPGGSLILTNGTLYGTSSGGGEYGYGTVFSLNTNGNFLTAIYSFSNNPDGAYPGNTLTLAGNTLYGTTLHGGSNDAGTVFSIGTNGANYAVLHQFTGTSDGMGPVSGLVVSGGKIYGTTSWGGTNAWGTVYSMNLEGSDYTALYNFADGPGGVYPSGGLIISSNTIYGTTSQGGDNDSGTVFSINTDGSNFKAIFSFPGDHPNYTDGQPESIGKLLLAGNVFYGVDTGVGGADNSGYVYSLYTDGSGFEVIYNFSPDPEADSNGTNIDGAIPVGVNPLISGNILYGTTIAGGTNMGSGTVFALELPVPPPVIKNIALTDSNSVTVFCLGGIGYTYYTQATTNLAGSPVSWVDISTNLVDASGYWQVTDSMTNGLWGYWQTNIIYAASTNSTGPGGAALDSGPIIGTNIVWVTQDMRFYRASSAP